MRVADKDNFDTPSPRHLVNFFTSNISGKSLKVFPLILAEHYFVKDSFVLDAISFVFYHYIMIVNFFDGIGLDQKKYSSI